MNKLYKCIILLILMMSNSWAKLPVDSYSFTVNCWKKPAVYEFQPLNFIEFPEVLPGDLENHDYERKLLSLAPKTFQNYIKTTSEYRMIEAPMNMPMSSIYDTLIIPPPGCGVFTLIQNNGLNKASILVNKEYWSKLSKEKKDFYLFNYFVQQFLKPGLAQSDYRKFSAYVASGYVEQFSQEQKNKFLDFFGIKE